LIDPQQETPALPRVEPSKGVVQKFDGVRLLLGYNNWMAGSAAGIAFTFPKPRDPGRVHIGVLCRPVGAASCLWISGSEEAGVVPATLSAAAEG
jgi:hypothetical protein